MSLSSRDFLLTSLYIHNNSNRLTVAALTVTVLQGRYVVLTVNDSLVESSLSDYMLNKNTLGVKKVRGQEEAAL